MFHHVIGFWRKMIINFEQKSTYLLTINSLYYSCGPNSSFLKVNRGYGIFPSQKMRKASGIADWGESDYSFELKYLFKQEKY